MFLRFKQRLTRHDVVLNMPAFMHLEEGAQQHHQFLLIGFILQRGRVQLLVKQHAAKNRTGRQFAHRADDRGRPEMVGTGGWAGPFRQRRVRLTAIRGRHGLRAKRHIGGNGRGAGVVVAADRAAAVARVMIQLQLIDIGLVGASQQHIHAVLIVAVFRRAVD